MVRVSLNVEGKMVFMRVYIEKLKILDEWNIWVLLFAICFCALSCLVLLLSYNVYMCMSRACWTSLHLFDCHLYAEVLKQIRKSLVLARFVAYCDIGPQVRNVLGLLVIQETDTHSMSSCGYHKSELLDQVMSDKSDSYVVHISDNSLAQAFHPVI